MAKNKRKYVIDYDAKTIARDIKEGRITYDDLTGAQRTLIMDYLHFVRGLGYNAISEILGVHRNTVYKRLKKIKEKEQKIVLDSLSKNEIIQDIYTTMNAQYESLVREGEHKEAFDTKVKGYRLLAELGALDGVNTQDNELKVTFHWSKPQNEETGQPQD